MKPLLLFFLLLTATQTYSQYAWTQEANYPSSAKWGAAGFSINGIGYIGSGVVSVNQVNDWWAYNPDSNSWKQVADYPGGNVVNGFSGAVNGKGYAGFGGATNWYAYDPTTNQWTKKANFPDASYYPSSVSGFVIGNKIYIGTGRYLDSYSDSCRTFWSYDAVADKWAQLADFGGIGRYGAVGFAINGKGYIGSGTTSYDQLSDFWEYDTTANKWTRKADFPAGGRYQAAGFAIGSKGYFGMGLDEYNNPQQDFYEFDPISNSWNYAANYPNTLYQPAWFVIGNVGYCGTGSDGSTEFYEFTGAPAITSIIKAASASDFTIYPNPSTGNLSIKPGSFAANFNVQVYNSIGEKVFSKSSCTAAAVQTIELVNPVAGFYEVCITDAATNAVVSTEKLLIIK